MVETARDLVQKGYTMIQKDHQEFLNKHGLFHEQNITFKFKEGGSITLQPQQ